MIPATIRQATPADAALATDISRRNFTQSFGSAYPAADLASFLAQSYSLARHAAWLDDDRHALFLLERGTEVLGHALVGPCALPHADVNASDGELKRLYILKHAHGSGLGSLLIHTALAWLLKDGARTLWVGVWSENFRAQKLYQRYGFTHAGEYHFEVGATRDFEFIYRRAAGS